MRETADEAPAEQLLRADSLSRVRTPAARRVEILAEFERSGLSGARFARLHGINYQTLMGWARKLRQPGRPEQPDPVGRLAARLGLREVSVGCPGSLEVEIAGGIRMRIQSLEQAELAARLIRHLQAGERGTPC